MTATMSAVEFFRLNAGYSYDPKTETPEQGQERCARELALAEQWLVSMPHQVVWQEELDADKSWLPAGDERPLFSCVVSVMDDGQWREESLYGIDLGETGVECPEYMRVVVAELALSLRS